MSTLKNLFLPLISSLIVSASALAFDNSDWAALAGDPVFNGDVNAIIEDDLGNIYFGGNFTTVNGNPANYIVMFDGTDFFPLGNGMNGQVWDLEFAEQDGILTLYAVGDFTHADGVYSPAIAQWDGTDWFVYGDIGLPGANLRSVTALGEGPNIYVSGKYTAGQFKNIAYWDYEEAAWFTLDYGVQGDANSIVWAIDANQDSVVAVGKFNSAGNLPSTHNIARWVEPSNTTFGGWVALEQGINGTGFCVKATSASVYVGGSFSHSGNTIPANEIGLNVAQYDELLGWTKLNQGINGPVTAIDVRGNQIYIGGNFSGSYEEAQSNIAYWDDRRGLWRKLGSGTNDVVRSVFVAEGDTDADDELYIGGVFTSAGGSPVSKTAVGTNLPVITRKPTGRILLIDNASVGFLGAVNVLENNGYDVFQITNEFINEYANLLDDGFLLEFDFIVYCERGPGNNFVGGDGVLLPDAVYFGLEDYIQRGGNLLVTGEDTLFNAVPPAVDINLSLLIRSVAPGGLASDNREWTIFNINHPVINGPYGDYRRQNFFQQFGYGGGILYDDDSVTPDFFNGAFQLIQTGGPAFPITAKLILTEIAASGGSVGYWNGGPDAGEQIVIEPAQPDFFSGAESQDVFLNYVEYALQNAINGVPPFSLFVNAANDAGLFGADADPDAIPFGDGVENIIKYAFNMDLTMFDDSIMAPGGFSGQPLITLENISGDDYIRFEYVRRLEAGLVYSPEFSYDMIDFFPVNVTPIVTPIDPDWERVVLLQPITALPAFGRVFVDFES